MIRRVALAFFIIFFACLPLSFAKDKLNINTANQSQLMELKGIGKSYAERIIQYREKNGPFKNIDELKNIKGIGIKILDANRDKIKVVVEKEKK